MKNFSIFLCLFTLLGTTVFAQLTPRSTSTSAGTTIPSQPISPSNFINTRTANGITLQLKRVKGNAADQTVTLEFLITNPKGNTRVVLRTAYAVDFEGDNYERGGHHFDETLYTDVPRKSSVSVEKIPSKIKSLSLFKFVIYSDLTGQDVDVEYRNLNIEW
ncbi:hypothetical protein [Runella sp.]|uniref:hypothetical protein n=1 Tax=Runella sp. TaxID=1960881 RepID=UPI00301B0DB4